jgi:ribosome maturation factor RimP
LERFFFARQDLRVMNWQGAVERTVCGLGYELVDAEKGAGGLLRVYIDHPPATTVEPKFITVDDCERVTRQLQHVLEVEGCAYERLEVSSPGLDRPLKKAADYARFAGEQVDITLKLPFKGRKKYRGELQVEGEGWRLVLPAADGGEQALDFALEEVREARLVAVVDFKGRRFSKPDNTPAETAPAAEPRSVDGLDGDRIQ